MFSGIIESSAPVLEILDGPGEKTLVIGTGYDDLVAGESIAVNGVCLTVTAPTPGEIRFYISQETLEKTNLGSLSKDATVNIERSLRLSDRNSGHMVQGHVDSTALVSSMSPIGQSFQLAVKLPPSLLHFCVNKGSIAVNGVSLTINEIKDNLIYLNLIPETLARTNLGALQTGDLVNIEVDMIAKHLEKICQNWTPRLSS